MAKEHVQCAKMGARGHQERPRTGLRGQSEGVWALLHGHWGVMEELREYPLRRTAGRRWIERREQEVEAISPEEWVP